MRLLRQLWFVVTRLRHEDDLAAELEFHRQMKAEELRADGVREAEVTARTQRALGNDLRARERARDVWVPPWLQDLSQDIKFGLRMLNKDRRFTMAAVVALALGIAVNGSVFTILNTAFWRDLPFEQSDRLVNIRMVAPRGPGGNLSYLDYRDWAEQVRSLEGLAAYAVGTMNVSEAGHAPIRMRGTWIHNTFAVLRAEPFAGRTFLAEDDRPGAPAVAVLSHDVWFGRYGGEMTAIGRTIRVNDVPATIVGVMPPGFNFPMSAQIWMPLSHYAGVFTATRGQRTIGAIGRLADGADLPQARAEFDQLAAAAAQAHPDTNKDLRVSVGRIREMYMGGAPRMFLATLVGAVGFVLLIACANVTTLLLARSAHRSREMAIRASLGASRWRLIRQVLIECTAIAVMAATLGIILSRFGSSAMSVAFYVMEMSSPETLVRPYWVDLSMDSMTWMFAGFLCLAASLGIGIMPSWYLSKTNANDILKDGGRSGSATLTAKRWTGSLIVVELALTLILLTGAGLLVRSYVATFFRDVVIDPANVITMRLELPAQKYATPERRRRFAADLNERLPKVPLFAGVTVANDVPLQPLGFSSRRLVIEGRPWAENEEPPSVTFTNVGDRYFDTVGLRVLRGRGLTDHDGRPGQEGVVVNEQFASRYFPDGTALSSRIQLSGPTLPAAGAPWLTIVGIVPTLPVFVDNRNEEPGVYLPFAAEAAPQRGMSIIVRAAGPEGSVSKTAAANALREQVSAIDPDLPVFGVQTMDEMVTRSRYSNRLIGSWFITLALIGLTLATVGLYALTAHGVAQRRQEIGVRMALGAHATQVVWLFMRRACLQLLAGLVIGLAGALVSGRLIQSAIGGTNPRDPLTIAVVSMLLIVVAITASIWPARKAARVDPAIALRAD